MTIDDRVDIVLVDGVGRCRVVKHSPFRQVIVYQARSWVLDTASKINDMAVYRLDGYGKSFPPIRWGN